MLRDRLRPRRRRRHVAAAAAAQGGRDHLPAHRRKLAAHSPASCCKLPTDLLAPCRHLVPNVVEEAGERRRHLLWPDRVAGIFCWRRLCFRPCSGIALCCRACWCAARGCGIRLRCCRRPCGCHRRWRQHKPKSRPLLLCRCRCRCCLLRTARCLGCRLHAVCCLGCSVLLLLRIFIQQLLQRRQRLRVAVRQRGIAFFGLCRTASGGRCWRAAALPRLLRLLRLLRRLLPWLLHPK